MLFSVVLMSLPICYSQDFVTLYQFISSCFGDSVFFTMRNRDSNRLKIGFPIQLKNLE